MKTHTKFLAALALAAAIMPGFGACPAHAASNDMAPAAPAVSGATAGRTDGLGITDEQRAKIKAVREKYRPAMKPLARQYMKEQRKLRRLVRADTIDEAAIRAQVSKMASVQANLAVQRAHALSEFRGVLTAEQIKKLKQARSGGNEGKRKDEWMGGDGY